MSLEILNPGRRTKEILRRDTAISPGCQTRSYVVAFERAKGCYIWDADGKRYLDFAAGIAVMNAGHTNKWVVKAVRKQAKKMLHAAYADFHCELPVQLAEELKTVLQKPLTQFFFSNSGTESVECAYKCARWHSNKKWTIAFDHCFHGRTMGSLSMTNSKPVQRERYSPFLPVKHAEYAYCYRCHWRQEYGSCNFECVDALEKVMRSVRGDNASVFIEPIQGEGGYVVPPKEFMKGIRRLCDKYHVLLCDDEVQAGYFRTGKFLAIENFGVKPDIVSLSKSLGHGLPIGVTVSSKKIMDWPPGAHSNTFGGNLIACAAALAGLKYMKAKHVADNTIKVGAYFKRRLYELQDKYEIIGDVRGIGLMLGIELVKNRKTKEPAKLERDKIINEAGKKGLILLPAGKSVIRFCPPLILTESQVDEGLAILEEALKQY